MIRVTETAGTLSQTLVMRINIAATVLALTTLGTASATTAEGHTQHRSAFMGKWDTPVMSLNPDSWVFGGPSPLLDIVLEGESTLGQIGQSDDIASLRNSTVRWHAVDDFTEVLA